MDAAERIGQIDIDITREDEGSPFDAWY
jgi:hypothetical protein